MDKKITYFDKVVNTVKKLDESRIMDALDILEGGKFDDFLVFGVENGSFTENDACTLYEGIKLYEDMSSEVSYEDPKRLALLCEHMGITKKHFEMYHKKNVTVPVNPTNFV